MKRLFDLIIAIFLVIIFIPIFFYISLSIKISSKGPIIYWSKRVGKNNILFNMPKFRSMHIDTPQVATHLLNNPEIYYSKIGKFIRKTSLDELPQIFSIIKGDMSFVGPRPALWNQEDLIECRTLKSIHTLTPGITGWAQVNGRDELSIDEKVNYDFEYLMKKSIRFDLVIIWLTFKNVIRKDGISH